MTVADPGLLAARRLLLEHLDMHPGQAVNADLDPAEVGIVGDTAHAAGGDSYHLGRDQIRARGGRPRYSVDESPRDQAGLDQRASALDIGWFRVVVDGKVHTLRTFSLWLVAECRAGAPDTLGIREVIYSPDGQTVKRWDRLGRRSSGDQSHLSHTHLSKFRDADGHQIAALIGRYLDEIGILEDDVTPEQVRAQIPGGIADFLVAAIGRKDKDGRNFGNYITKLFVAPILAGVAGVDDQVLAGLAPLFTELLAAIVADPGNTIDLRPEQVTELASLLAAQLPAPPSAAEVAAAVNDNAAARLTS